MRIVELEVSNFSGLTSEVYVGIAAQSLVGSAA